MKNNNPLLGVNLNPTEPVKFDSIPYNEEPSVIINKSSTQRFLVPDVEDKEYERINLMKSDIYSEMRTKVVGTTASGKTAMLDIQSLVHEAENAGYKLKVFDIAELGTSWKGFSPFNDTYDILGEDRLSFIEQLSKISEFTIIEEDDLHTRIRYKKKKGYTEEELDKLYSDFIALKNSLKVQIRNVSTHVN